MNFRINFKKMKDEFKKIKSESEKRFLKKLIVKKAKAKAICPDQKS